MENNGNHLIGRLRPTRAIALLFVALILLLATVMSAFSASISAPAKVSEGEQISVSMSGTGPLSIARNGVTVAAGTGSISDTLATNSTSAGLYTYTFTDASGTENRSIEVLDVPLTVTVLAPSTNDVATNSVTFSLQSNWNPEFCYVNIDGTSHTLAASGTTFTGEFQVSDGVHTIDYKCKLGDTIASTTRSIHVDTKPPTVTASGPSGEVNGPHVTLTADTDEISQCRYSASDLPYEQMQQMSSSYVLRNTVTIQTSEHASYTYFVRCSDVHGNTMPSSQIISFLNRMPPVASITIDEEEPLKAGTYKITLETSAPLAGAPTLNYDLQETGRKQQVALTGSGDLWTGYVTIPGDAKDDVVSFSFTGTSIQGVIGTQIAEGAFFTIDTMPPAAVDAISIESGKQITVRWFSTSSEEHAAYYIYRSEQERVDYTHYYTSTVRTEFTDFGATGSQYYYYRVAAVDAAGNIGPLSDEVYGSVINTMLDEPVADPLALARINEELANVHSALLDANATITTLEEERSPVVNQIIKDMRLLDDARTALRKLESSKSMLEELRSRAPSTQETDAAIAQSRNLIGEARHLLIRRIMPDQQTETTQTADDASSQRYMAYMLTGRSLSQQEEQEYAAVVRTLQDRATVALRASTFTLYDASGEERKYTFVHKRISLQDPANDITVIEVVPKGVEISFSPQPAVTDPVRFSYGVLHEAEYSYVIKQHLSLDEVKATRTLLYPAVPQLQVVQQDSMLTGFAVSELMPTGDAPLIVLGIIIIIALGAYYVSLEPKGPKRVLEQPVQFRPAHSRIVQRPLQRTVQSSVAGQPSQSILIKEPRAEDLLKSAEILIDEKGYDEALVEYKRLIAVLQKDKGLEEIMHEDTKRVYAKLLLFKRLTDASTAAERADKESLRTALADVRHVAAEIGENQTRLMTEAKASYAAFMRKLNALEIEHERY